MPWLPAFLRWLSLFSFLFHLFSLPLLTPCRSNSAHTSLAATLLAPATVAGIGISVMLHGVAFWLVVLGGSGSPGQSKPDQSVDAAPGIAIVLRPVIAEPPPQPPPQPLPPPQPQPPVEPPTTSPPMRVPITAPAAARTVERPAAPNENTKPAPNYIPQPPPPPSFVPPAPASVSFAGLSSTGDVAKGVVYAVDCSGPMITSMPLVAEELLRSIAALSPEQRFSVVAFHDAAGSAKSRAFSAELIAPSREALVQLAKWLDGLDIGGSSNPMDGLRTSLALTRGHKPAVVFLLCRSISRTEGNAWQLSGEETLRELDSLNPVDPATGKRAAAIKTIQFIEPDTSRTLERIAREHGGDASPESSLKVITPGEMRRK